MGSFNINCGVSNRIITEGEEVTLFFIANPGLIQTYCGTSSPWKLISFPIEAVYEDYGRLEINKDNLNYKVFIDNLKDSMVEMLVEEKEPGSRLSQDITRETLENLELVHLFDAMQEGYLKMKRAFYDGPHEIKPFVISKDLYTALMKSSFPGFTYSDDEYKISKEYFRKDMVKSLEITKKEIMSSLMGPDKESSEEEINEYNEFRIQIEMDRFFSENFSYDMSYMPKFLRSHFETLGETRTLETFAEIKFLLSLFNAAPFEISPTIYAPQDTCNSAAFLLNRLRYQECRDYVKNYLFGEDGVDEEYDTYKLVDNYTKNLLE